jgi:hypothetical protein
LRELFRPERWQVLAETVSATQGRSGDAVIRIAISQAAFDAVVATSSLATLLLETRENMVD